MEQWGLTYAFMGQACHFVGRFSFFEVGRNTGPTWNSLWDSCRFTSSLMTLPGRSLTGNELIDEKLFPAKDWRMRSLSSFAEKSDAVKSFGEVKWRVPTSFTEACRPALVKSLTATGPVFRRVLYFWEWGMPSSTCSFVVVLLVGASTGAARSSNETRSGEVTGVRAGLRPRLLDAVVPGRSASRDAV